MCFGRAKLLLSRSPCRSHTRVPGSPPGRRLLTAHHPICPQSIHYLPPTQRNSCDWSPSESSEEQPCGVWSGVLTATDGDRNYFTNSHRARSDRQPECRDQWALLFAKADFLNGFPGAIFCSTVPAGDSRTLVVWSFRGPLRNFAQQNRLVLWSLQIRTDGRQFSAVEHRILLCNTQSGQER